MGFCLWGVFFAPVVAFCYSCPFQGTVVQSVPTLGKFLVFPNTWCKILQILCAILSKFARRIVSTCRKWRIVSNLARKNGISSDQLAHLGAKIVKSCQNFRPSRTPVPTRATSCPALQIPPNVWSALSTKLQKVRACTESFCPHGGCWGMWHPSYV